MRTRNRDTGTEDAVRAVLLAEYEALKAEQKSRIALRDRLVYTALAALAATLALALQPVERPHLVLLLPLVCVVLGWTHLANDQKITAIGAYLRGEVAPVLAHRAAPLANLLSWETHHRASRYRRVDKCAQLAVDLLIFAVPSLLATAFYWAAVDIHPALFAGSVLEALVTLALATRVILAADLSSGTGVRSEVPPSLASPLGPVPDRRRTSTTTQRSSEISHSDRGPVASGAIAAHAQAARRLQSAHPANRVLTDMTGLKPAVRCR